MPGCGGPCVFFGQSLLLNTNVKKQSTESRSDYENVTDSANIKNKIKNLMSQEMIMKMRVTVQMFTKIVGSKSDYENVTDSANVKKSTESRSDHENVTDSVNVKKLH